LNKNCFIFRRLIVIYAVFFVVTAKLLTHVSQEINLLTQKGGLALWHLSKQKMH